MRLWVTMAGADIESPTATAHDFGWVPVFPGSVLSVSGRHNVVSYGDGDTPKWAMIRASGTESLRRAGTALIHGARSRSRRALDHDGHLLMALPTLGSAKPDAPSSRYPQYFR